MSSGTGEEYAVTCRKERLNCKCATFKATADQLRALAPGDGPEARDRGETDSVQDR